MFLPSFWLKSFRCLVFLLPLFPPSFKKKSKLAGDMWENEEERRVRWAERGTGVGEKAKENNDNNLTL